MKKILLLIKVVLIIFVISMCMLQNEILFSQFLRDGGNSNKKKKTIENIDKKDRKQKSKLPSYIAFNIKAEKIADLRNAIKITWEVNPHYHDDFIVGRALEVIDTKEKALKSQSVKVIKARSRNVFIDTDL